MTRAPGSFSIGIGSPVHYRRLRVGQVVAYDLARDGKKVEVRIFVEINPGKTAKRIPIEQVLVDKKTGKPMPKVKWLFTGSAMQRPNPDKPEVYGADESGTLIAIFPVTAETVFQSSLSLADEKYVKLETNTKLPAVGTAVNLVIVAPAK